jgi:hypothetical protein
LRAITRNIFRYNATAELGDEGRILTPFIGDKPALQQSCDPQQALDKLLSFCIREKSFPLLLRTFKYAFSKIQNQLKTVNDKIYEVYSRHAEQTDFRPKRHKVTP